MVPLWRQAFDSWEKAASPMLQQTAVSPGFRDFMRVSTRVKKAVAAEFEKASRQCLHAMNLPAATDVRRLKAQVRELDKELHGVRTAVESMAEDATIRDLNALLTDAKVTDAKVTVAKVADAKVADAKVAVAKVAVAKVTEKSEESR